MPYQRILTDPAPYGAWIRAANADFPEHRHADIELHYCICGEFRILLEKKEYTVRAGELIFISPSVSHALPVQAENDGSVLTVVLGFSFLGKSFSAFSDVQFPSPLLAREESNPASEEIFSLLTQTAAACESAAPTSELLIRGNLYKIFYGLSRLLSSAEIAATRGKNPRLLKNIDRALDLIHFDYRSALSVDTAAAVTGYSKSNFCKIFKEITGESFHAALNRHRTEIASELLSESALSVAEISDAVGFSETKTFCRIFKSLKGTSPGAYRKRLRH